MPAETAGDGLHKLSIIVFSGDFDRVHYALVTAAAAAATNRRVTLFFTMGASRALLAADADGRPGWHKLAGSPGGPSAADMDARYGASGVATFDELIAACAALGTTFMICEMGLRALDLEGAALRPDIAVAAGGVVTFLNDAEADGAMLFI